MSKYMDGAGLAYLWEKLKTLLAKNDLSNVTNVDFLSKANTAGAGVIRSVDASSDDGIAFTGSADGITELTPGLMILMIPGRSTSTQTPTFNLNGLGAVNIKRKLSSGTATVTSGGGTTFLYKGRPSLLMYDTAISSSPCWIAMEFTKPNSNDLYGQVPIASGGTGASTAAQARVNLGIETSGGTVTSQNADYSEIGEWADGNTNDEDRIGYFVAVDPSTAGTTMVKASSTMDVRGVTVTAPAFSGNCAAEKFDADTGELLKQYDYVAVMGLVSVIDNGTCTVNERCMPDDDGMAIPSTNNMGYQVIDRIDSTHILIAVEPGADMLNRIKTSVTDLQNGKAPSTHASQHATGGSDPITPEIIGAAKEPISRSVTLSASGWDSTAKTQTITVSGVLADETKQLITPTPAVASQDAYYNSGIRCTNQAADNLTFTAKTIPTADLTVYVTIQEVGA